jgi:hypothetical protein
MPLVLPSNSMHSVATLDANAERIEHVAAFMCRGKNRIAPREAFEKAGQLDHRLAICQRRLDRLKQLPRG